MLTAEVDCLETVHLPWA